MLSLYSIDAASLHACSLHDVNLHEINQLQSKWCHWRGAVCAEIAVWFRQPSNKQNLQGKDVVHRLLLLLRRNQPVRSKFSDLRGLMALALT